jgi:OmpA-OmpF porin, OOP family
VSQVIRTFAPTGLLLLMAVAATAQLKDYDGFKDPALFTRLPNYFLSEGGSFVDTQFDGHDFRVVEGKKDEYRRVEGHYQKYGYTFDDSRGAAAASSLQIIRNYQNAATRIGGKVLFDGGDRSTIRIVKDGKETWVDVEAYGNNYGVQIIERQSMQQDVTANAAALQGGLAQDGHVAVPGIYFDFGKSEVKPESEPALKEVVKLLQTSPSIRLWVVGHTDSVGSAESNVTLSNARAASVIRVLTQQMGVDPKRLAPHGSGPFAPVAANKTDEGRARNRRVELVEQP